MAEAGSETDDDLQDLNEDQQAISEADSHGEQILGAADDTSQAALLRCRWEEVFRPESSTSYDQLMWKEFEWPVTALEWQPQAWQPPGSITALQQVAAEEAADLALQRSASSSCSSGSKEKVLLPLDYHYLVMGNSTSGQEQASVWLCRVALAGQLPANFDPQEQECVVMPAEVTGVLELSHGHQDVNRLHIMPSNPSLLATCCDEPQVYIWDLATTAAADSSSGSSGRDSRATSGSSGSAACPRAVLAGRTEGGFALQWSPTQPGLLLGADLKGGVQLWDLQAGASNTSVQPVQAVQDFAACAINDVCWHSNGNQFAAAAADGRLLLQDVRAPASAAAAAPAASCTAQTQAAGTATTANWGSPSASAIAAHSCSAAWGSSRAEVQVHTTRLRRGAHLQDKFHLTQDCYTVAFDAHNEFQMASGGADGCVYLLDTRRLDRPLHVLAQHAGSVTQVAWSPCVPGLLASTGEDGFVLLWDCNQLQHVPAAQQPPNTQVSGLGAGAGRRKQQQPRQRKQQQQQPALADEVHPAQPHDSKLLQKMRQLVKPGLQFVHHGHLSRLEAAAWNPDKPWVIASASQAAMAEDRAGHEVEVQGNLLMVWEVNRSVGLIW